MIYGFEDFELDTDRRELRAAGTPVAIPPKALAVLAYLVAHADRMVPKAELLDAFWARNVSEAALQTTISVVRKAVGCHRERPVIRTYHGRGFRFVLPLKDAPVAAPDARGADEAELAPPRERRLVTVLSVHVTSDDATGARDDDARQHGAVEDFMATVRGRVEAEDGLLMHMMLDGVTAVFGTGASSEDAARRAVTCASDLARDVAAAVPGAAGRTASFGVESGQISIEDANGAWALPGAIERAASWLARSAAPGEILIGESARRHLGDEIEAEPVKGGFRLRRAPEARAGIPARPLRRASRFVGRAPELAFLGTCLAGATAGEGQAAILAGPAGIGKTRLVREFLSGLDAGQTPQIVIHCLPRLADTPFAPIQQLCRVLFGAQDAPDDPVDAALCRRLMQQDSPRDKSLDGLSERVIRKRSRALLMDAVARACARAPHVLVVEDVHWIDAASRSMLEALIRHADQWRLLIVATTRPTEDAPLSEAVIQLSPLGRGDSLELLRAVSPEAGEHAADAETLIRRAGGNPFFLEELALAAQGEADPENHLPDTVQAVMETRIAALEPAARAFLYAVAIIGPSAPGGLIAALLGIGEADVESALARLVRMGFLRDDAEGVSFRHMLLQDTAYAMIAPGDRRRLHREVAALLERSGRPVPPEILAQHLEAAGEAARATAYWTKASNAALFRSSGRAAITFAQRGLALIEPGQPDAARAEMGLQLSLAAAQMTQKGYGAAQVGEAYARALTLSEDTGAPEARMRALMGLWVHSWVAGRLKDSLGHGREILALADAAGDSSLQLQAHGSIGSVLMHTGAFAEAMAHLEQGMQLAEEAPPATVTAQNTAVTCAAYAAWVCAIRGDEAGFGRFFERSEALSRVIENPFSVAIHSALCSDAIMCMGDVAAARELARGTVAISREQGFPFWLGTGLVLQGWAEGQRGAIEEGLAAIDEGIAVFEATHARVQLPNWYGLKAETLLAAGQAATGIEAAQRALDCAAQTGDVWFNPRIHAVSAALHREAGEAEAAARHEAEVARMTGLHGLARAFVTVAPAA